MKRIGATLLHWLVHHYRPLCQRGLLLEPARDLHAARVAFERPVASVVVARRPDASTETAMCEPYDGVTT